MHECKNIRPGRFNQIASIFLNLAPKGPLSSQALSLILRILLTLIELKLSSNKFKRDVTHDKLE